MRKGRGAKRAALAVVGAIAAVGMLAPTASASEEFPTCEVMFGQEWCDEYYYGPIGTVTSVAGPVVTLAYETTWDTVDAVFQTAIWAGKTYDCTVWGVRCDS